MANFSRLTQSDLEKMGLSLQPDGSYKKVSIATIPHPKQNVQVRLVEPSVSTALRKISLILKGEPMPKQSVRGTRSGHYYQPQKTVDRKNDYISQIRRQLPSNFKMFEKIVHITKMHFVFAPLKAFQKQKGVMGKINKGEIVWKTTKPDVSDNLKKLPLDSLSGLVYKDDNIIVSEDNIKKYYGTGGCIIIEMSGY